MGETDDLSLKLIGLYVPAPTSRLHCSEAVLQLSENVTHFAICFTYTCIISKE
jgi:hypothetical protein